MRRPKKEKRAETGSGFLEGSWTERGAGASGLERSKPWVILFTNVSPLGRRKRCCQLPASITDIKHVYEKNQVFIVTSCAAWVSGLRIGISTYDSQRRLSGGFQSYPWSPRQLWGMFPPEVGLVEQLPGTASLEGKTKWLQGGFFLKNHFLFFLFGSDGCCHWLYLFFARQLEAGRRCETRRPFNFRENEVTPHDLHLRITDTVTIMWATPTSAVPIPVHSACIHRHNARYAIFKKISRHWLSECQL